MPTLRERNRLATMRETQALALRRFREKGFDVVTVAEIASELGMAASTVYRHFGTKENLVLWDEHDPAVEAELEARLGHGPPFLAIRDALVAGLAPHYEEHSAQVREKIEFIYATPALHGPAVADDYRIRLELAEALRSLGSPAVRRAASILAGASVLAMNAAIEAWVLDGGDTPLAGHLQEAFGTLTRLETLA